MESVRVLVRCRPLSQKEVSDGHKRVVNVDSPKGRIDVRRTPNNPSEAVRSFSFDSVYDSGSTQEEVYEESFRPLVDSVLKGFNGTIFAYGQTGTGKTWTVEGTENTPGLIPRAFTHIFDRINSADVDSQFLVRASYLEIYQEEIHDLLSKDPTSKCELKERPDTGVYVKDLSSFVCKSISEIQHVLNAGKANRTIGATNMNENSSRSHAIFLITIECSNNEHIRVGKLNLVDLAGSERQAKTGATGNRLKEATKINLSLSALGNVISALVDGQSTYIPYRDSKLTRLLQDSLGGNAKTVMVANIGPADYNYDETLTTLRYANRAKNIKNKPTINEDPKDALLREFQEEIARLKSRLYGKHKHVGSAKKRRTVHNSSSSPPPSQDEHGEDDDKLMGAQNKLAVERELLEGDTSLLAEEKKHLLHKLENKENELKKQVSEREKMVNKIKAMESKLIKGDGSCNMIEKTNQQQRVLEQQKTDLYERKRLERLTAQELEATEEQGEVLENSYSSLQNEVESKTRKLKKMFLRLQTLKQDIVDVTEEYNRDRRDLEQNQQELLKELKLKHLMIENFISGDEKRKILSRAQFDDEENTWFLVCGNGGTLSSSTTSDCSNISLVSSTCSSVITKRPVSSHQSRRPVSEYARKCQFENNNVWRYRGENIMRLELDGFRRTTRDYEGPQVAPRVQAVLDAAMLNVEPDIELDVGRLNNTHSVRGSIKQRFNGNTNNIGKNAGCSMNPAKNYPSSRGLVPK
uniref:Kinesin-like protein n=1 Tax=Lepeophtheirus salmonis TaxID=72036 RepID=A0A0K2TUX2_LEPSM